MRYFQSQEGEWDSNGQVLWIAHRHTRCTGQALSESLFTAQAKAFENRIFASLHQAPGYKKYQAIPASPYRRMDPGSLVADYPLQITLPDDPRIMRTLSYLISHCSYDNAFFQDMIHSGINIYLTLAMAQAFLRSRDTRYRDLITTVADLASPTGQWPEAINPLTGGGCMGDGQHGWAAAEWILIMRSLFIREEGDRLVLGSGLFPQWLKKNTPLSFGPTRMPGGIVTVTYPIRQGPGTVS